MTRIGGSSPGHIQPTPSSGPGRKKDLPLEHLPEELPPPSDIKPSSTELSKLFLPEKIDLSRVPKDHPVHELLRKLLLQVTLKAIVSGGEHSKSSLPPTPPMEPL